MCVCIHALECFFRAGRINWGLPNTCECKGQGAFEDSGLPPLVCLCTCLFSSEKQSLLEVCGCIPIFSGAIFLC